MLVNVCMIVSTFMIHSEKELSTLQFKKKSHFIYYYYLTLNQLVNFLLESKIPDVNLFKLMSVFSSG